MEEKELKKSWKGFVWWIVGYIAALAGIALLPVADEALMIRLVMGMTATMMALLAWIVLKTGYVYWYNGIEYKEAVKAGAARREAYARAHFERFRLLALVSLLLLAAAQGLGIPWWIDFIVCTAALIAVAISTINIKL